MDKEQLLEEALFALVQVCFDQGLTEDKITRTVNRAISEYEEDAGQEEG